MDNTDPTGRGQAAASAPQLPDSFENPGSRRKKASKVTALVLLVLAAGAASLLYFACKPPAREEKKSLDLVSVSVVKPAYRELGNSFSVIGTVKAKNEVTAVSETSGRIVAMPAAIGATVSADDPLVAVDSDLREAALLAAEAAYKKASKDAARAKTLHEGGLVSDADFEAARLGETSAKAHYLVAKKEYENTTIRAPIGGVVADTFVSKGGQIGPGTPVALIVDASRLKVKVLLPERNAIRQKAGDRVAITTDLYPGRTFQGQIESISVRGDDSHAFPTEVALLGGASKELRAGMSVRLEFSGGSARKALLIPRSTILGSVRSPEVFTVTHGSGYTASRRAIVVGEESGTDIEVVSGLGENDLVVSGGQSLISEGQEVRVVSSGASL